MRSGMLNCAIVYPATISLLHEACLACLGSLGRLRSGERSKGHCIKTNIRFGCKLCDYIGAIWGHYSQVFQTLILETRAQAGLGHHAISEAAASANFSWTLWGLGCRESGWSGRPTLPNKAPEPQM